MLTELGDIAFQAIAKADPGVKSIWGLRQGSQKRPLAQASASAQRRAVRRVLLEDQY